VAHGPCESCGSSDARFTYPDGSQHCFSCKDHRFADRGAVVGGRMDEGPPSHRLEKAPAPARKSGLIEVEVDALVPRKITLETSQHFGVGYGELRGDRCQVYPYADARGRVVAQKLRFEGKRFQIVGDAKKMGLFGAHLWKNGGKYLIVTEGEVDALSFSQVQGNKWPVVSIPNGAQNALKDCKASLEWLETFETVVLAFDADEPGRAAAQEVAALLSPGKAKIVHWPEGIKDANDLLKAGRAKELVECFWNAHAWRPDGLLTGDAVWERLLLKDSVGAVKVPHSGLQTKTRGIQPAETWLLVAGTGSGKSTTSREWAAQFAAQGIKVGYIGLEEGIRTSAIGLLGVLTNRRLLLEENLDPREPDIRKAFDRIKDKVVYYDHFGSLESDHLVSKIRFMFKGEGCRVVFLDHISIVVSGMDGERDERRELDRLCTKLSSLVQETRCSIVAVCHLSRKEGTPHEEGRPVTLADLRGSHGLAQLGYTIISLERDQQAATDDERDLSLVRVVKCRHTGMTGPAGYVRYHPDTGRQLEELDAPVTLTDGDAQGTL